MTTSLAGSCLCGAIRYTVDVPITELRACHCTHCQKASGAAGSVNAVIPSASFHLTQGRLKRHDSAADSGHTLYRFFCGNCGSPIYSQRAAAPETVVLRAGTFDGGRHEDRHQHLDPQRALVGPYRSGEQSVPRPARPACRQTPGDFMKLWYSPPSPFARKVRVAAIELGLAGRIEEIRIAVAPHKPNEAFARNNPLMKIPALETGEGSVFYDSRVICEYLDALAGGARLFPAGGDAAGRAAAPGARRRDPRRRHPAALRARAAPRSAALGRVARGAAAQS